MQFKVAWIALATMAAVAISFWVALDQHEATERRILASQEQSNDASELTYWSLEALLAASSSSYAAINDIPSQYRQNVRCMMQVLQKTPRVDQVESGVWNYGWARPFVQYRYQEQDGRAGTVRFVAEKPHDPMMMSEAGLPDSTHLFATTLNGLATAGGPLPAGFGTREISRQWESQCGVTVLVEMD
jgi:hypothetical protein